MQSSTKEIENSLEVTLLNNNIGAIPTRIKVNETVTKKILHRCSFKKFNTSNFTLDLKLTWLRDFFPPVSVDC